MPKGVPVFSSPTEVRVPTIRGGRPPSADHGGVSMVSESTPPPVVSALRRGSRGNSFQGSQSGDEEKELGHLIDVSFRHRRQQATVILADRLKDVGYRHATEGRHLDLIKDMLIPPTKEADAQAGA